MAYSSHSANGILKLRRYNQLMALNITQELETDLVLKINWTLGPTKGALRQRPQRFRTSNTVQRATNASRDRCFNTSVGVPPKLRQVLVPSQIGPDHPGVDRFGQR